MHTRPSASPPGAPPEPGQSPPGGRPGGRAPEEVVGLAGVGYRAPDFCILHDITLSVRGGEFWVVLGPNGAGKTSLLRLCGAQEVPSTGELTVLGRTVGRTDLRELRGDIAFISPSVERRLRPQLSAAEIVLAGKDGSLAPWWQDFTDEDRARATRLLGMVGLPDEVTGKQFALLSTGERTRVQLARALMSGSRLMLLDEPLAGLDLGAREHMLDLLCDVFLTHAETAVMVTHHLEEIPVIATHAALVRDGTILASGPIADVLTGEGVSACFDHPLRVESVGGRWYARSAKGPDGPRAG